MIATHNHFDHVGGVRRLKENMSALFVMNPDDVILNEVNEQWVRLMHFERFWERPPEPDIAISEGRVSLGDVSFKAIHTPGHTPGHVSLILEDRGVIFTGDLLFKRGVGRCDLPFSDCEELKRSLLRLRTVVPVSAWVMPGHGPPFRLKEAVMLIRLG